ncbi:MAG TPA: Gfo/Idh/MocA family oxidoreductase [Woeseiaceae bacterium]|nr:Gfo/Idh/MocA family oxidoreductase [Woeseiaceae bacterium]
MQYDERQAGRPQECDDRSSGAAREAIDRDRRRLLCATGSGLLLGGFMAGQTTASRAAAPQLRWGVVGTGGIANRMAPMIAAAPSAALSAVSSRRMETAREFATAHDVGRAFDDWEAMLGWDGIDAVYVATPTSVREEISLAAAGRGKHVLAEKPFASLDSLRRITRACRDNGVAFMDGTHFPHHPRTPAVRDRIARDIGWPWSLASAFQFSLPDRGNIRYDTTLEPMGAIGDAGWYNMRAVVEYLDPDVALTATTCFARRDPETGAVVSASGVLAFADGATSTFDCGFDSGALVMDLRVTGANGVLWMDDYVIAKSADEAAYAWGSGGPNDLSRVTIAATLPAAAQMFEDFAVAAADAPSRDQWMQASERTQALLDGVWNAAIRHDDPACDS